MSNIFNDKFIDGETLLDKNNLNPMVNKIIQNSSDITEIGDVVTDHILNHPEGSICNVNKEYVDTELEKKVEKVSGKQLSDNNYTTDDKNKLQGLENYLHPLTHDASIIIQDSNNRMVTDVKISEWDSKSNSNHFHDTYVEKVSGKNLSANDFTDEYKAKVDGLEGKSNFDGDYNSLTNKPTIDVNKSYVDTADLKKVDKVIGKSLVSDDEITRLSTVVNYNDTLIKADISKKANISDLHSHTNKVELDKVAIGDKAKWDNKSNFSGDYNDLINKPTIPIIDVNKKYVDDELDKKANNHSHPYKSDSYVPTWNDLINKPSIPTKTSQLTNDSSFASETFVTNKITEASLGGGEVDISGYATKVELNAKVDKVSGKGLSTVDFTMAKNDKLNGLSNYTHPNDTSVRHVTDAEKTNWNAKSNFSGNYDDLTNKPTLLKGEQGLPGAKGETGERGLKGADGVGLDNTIYTTNVSGGILTLTTKRLQKATIPDATEIRLPTVSTYTEIYLYFDTTTDLTLILPSCKWQGEPSFKANKSYEIIFTYTTEWLGGVNEYA